MVCVLAPAPNLMKWEDDGDDPTMGNVNTTCAEPPGVVLGIDASRSRSGGARTHLIGILSEGNPPVQGILRVHVWAYRSLLDALPDRPWLIKHSPAALQRGLFMQMWWQRFRFPAELRKAGCSIVLNTDAGTVGGFGPAVTMSRDMLSYEPGAISRYGWSKARLRLILLRYFQNRSLRRAAGAVFLTRYAAKVIQRSCGELANVAYIPHGVGATFRAAKPALSWPLRGGRAIRCTYVSNAAPYKHQWEVVRAIELLRRSGLDITLTLIGGGAGKAQGRLDRQLALSDPGRTFVKQLAFVAQQELPAYLEQADLFVFASSCENMPNTLVEAMAVGLPIACSNRGPMPEVLQDAGVYFDPEQPQTIADAIRKIVDDGSLRELISKRAKQLAERYSWSRCAEETWSFICATERRMSLK